MTSVPQDDREKQAAIKAGYFARLLDAARAYAARGWTVIPIWGDADPERPTASAIWWPPFQVQQPDDDELMYWFSVRRFGGLALVTGASSHLGVLTLASPELLAAFSKSFPHLVNTRRIQPGENDLAHLYYTLNFETAAARSVLVPGAALLLNGSYVVAPPTTLFTGVLLRTCARTWTGQAPAVDPLLLTGAALDELRAWLLSLPANRGPGRDVLIMCDSFPLRGPGSSAHKRYTPAGNAKRCRGRLGLVELLKSAWRASCPRLLKVFRRRQPERSERSERSGASLSRTALTACGPGHLPLSAVASSNPELPTGEVNL